VIPAVIGPDKILRSGTDGLRYLADLAGAADVTLSLPAGAEAESAPGRPAARAA
jgi:hypothetical protein